MSVTWAGQSTTINASSTSTVAPGVAASPTGPAGGDLSGSYPNPTVDGLQGRPVAATAPNASEVLAWNGSQWVPTVNGVGTVTSVVAGTGLTGGTITSSGTVAANFGTAAGTVCEGNDARLSNARTPTGIAGGDLTGTYPNPTVTANAIDNTKLRDSAALSVLGRSANTSGDPADITAGTDGFVLRRAGTALGFGTVATGGIADDAVTYAKIQNVSAADRILGRATAGAGDVEEIVCTAFARSVLDDADAATARTTLGLGSGDTPTFTGISLANGEFITNSVDGVIRLGTNGTSASHYAFTVDGVTWGSGIQLGTRRNSDGNTAAGIWFTAPLVTGNGVPFSLGTGQWYTLSYQESSGQGCATVGLLTGAQNAGSSGALVICVNNEKGGSNRVPTTDHADPTLYIYGRGSANAADYVRINHNTTDGTIEAGRGVMIVTGASGVRINGSFGFGTAPTAVQTGYTTFTNLTTDRTCDADATTVAELADILGTLIQDLKAKGLISA